MVSSTPRPHFTPGKDLVLILQEGGWAPGPVLMGGKSRPHRNSIPDSPARSQLLYRLSYRAHNPEGVISQNVFATTNAKNFIKVKILKHTYSFILCVICICLHALLYHIDAFALYNLSLDIPQVLNSFCMLVIKFHILHSVHYNSVITIRTTKCAKFYYSHKIETHQLSCVLI